MAEDLGLVLTRRHRIDPNRIPPTPADWEHEPWSAWRTELVDVADTVRPLLVEDLLSRAEPYLAGAIPEPPQDGPRRFMHNDICPDHVLVDRHTGRLAGLIDFTDAMVGDPLHDFVGLVPIGGRSFVDKVLAHYGLPLGEEFDSKLDWFSRVLSLTWLAEAAAEDTDAIDKHLVWVDRAFEE